MRKPIWKYLTLALETLPIVEPIYEFGAFQVDGDATYDVRQLCPGREFVGCDMREGPGVDKVLDLHNIDLADASAGTVIMMDTLEHVEYPHRAVEEVHRILRPGGVLIMSSVLDFFIHDHPNDFWRFTPDGFRSLLKPFTQSHVGYYGREVFPHTLVGVGCKGLEYDLSTYLQRYQVWADKQTALVEKISIKMMRDAIEALDAQLN